MTSLYFILFLVVALTLLFGAHYLVYVSILAFFPITSLLSKQILMGTLGFLALSFLLASLLSHWQENVFTLAFYALAGLWLAFVINLVLAILLAKIFLFGLRTAGFTPNLMLFGIFFFSLACAFSLYGVWNAFNPIVKDITVSIPNLPEQWNQQKIVQISDVHLGHIYRADYLKKIVAEINALHPSLVLITGDLFDGMDGNLQSFVPALKEIQAKYGVFFVTGNHETYLGVEKSLNILREAKVMILQDEVVDVAGLKLAGIAYAERAQTKDIVAVIKSLAKQFSGFPTILLYHAPFRIPEISQSGVNLQLSGHTHQGQLFPFECITSLIYAGYDYGEYRLGDYTLYTTSGAGTWGPPMRTSGRSEIVAITLQTKTLASLKILQ